MPALLWNGPKGRNDRGQMGRKAAALSAVPELRRLWRSTETYTGLAAPEVHAAPESSPMGLGQLIRV
jgi:hypothetical protein